MDPIAVMSLLTGGLAFVDKFFSVADKMAGEPSGTVKQSDDRVVINDHGYEQVVAADELVLSAFDKVRHDTLKKRLDVNWKQYNEVDLAMASAAADEKARLGVQKDKLTSELCVDFRQLVQMYEKVLNKPIPDHYWLESICPPETWPKP